MPGVRLTDKGLSPKCEYTTSEERCQIERGQRESLIDHPVAVDGDDRYWLSETEADTLNPQLFGFPCHYQHATTLYCYLLHYAFCPGPGQGRDVRCLFLLPSDSPLSEQRQDPIFLFFSPCIVICSSFPPHELSSSTLIPSLFCVFAHCSLTVITCFFALTWFGLHSCF